MGFKSNRTPENTLFKQKVVNHMYHDIFIFPETHCINDENVEFENYLVYSNNRVPNGRSVKGSGGIAIAFHSSLLKSHTILSVVKGIDGQIAVKLKCNISDLKVGILGLYLSPDSYKYGQESEDFFNQASVLWQSFSDCDLLIGGGDLNART